MVNKIKSIEEFANAISKGNVVVDFYATWCGPCMMLEPVTEEMSERYPNINFYKVDVDEMEAIAAKFNIYSIPTVYFFKDGKAVKNFLGYRDENSFAKIIEETF